MAVSLRFPFPASLMEDPRHRAMFPLELVSVFQFALLIYEHRKKSFQDLTQQAVGYHDTSPLPAQCAQASPVRAHRDQAQASDADSKRGATAHGTVSTS